jgi:hypothetical protein
MPFSRRTFLGALLCALLALPAISAGTASAAPTAAPAEFYGANIQALIRQGFVNAPSWDTFLRSGSQAGLKIARFDAPWDWAEPKKPGADGVHRYDWRRLDQIAGVLAAQNLRWLPVIDLPPAWAKDGDNQLPDERQADFAAFAGAFAARYGDGGSFWAQHPEYTPYPVQQAEVWTEANSSHFWVADPDAAHYLALYEQVRAAMKAATPSMQVLLSLGWQDFQGFTSRLYDAGLKGQSDGVAFHPYAPTARGVVVLTRKLRDILTTHGESDLPIYITEIGWPSAPSGPGAARAFDGPVSDASRAATTALAADALAAADCNVKDYIFYSLVEQQKDPANLEDWLGLYNLDGTPTQTLQALSSSAERWSAVGATTRARSAAVGSNTLLPLCHGPTNDKAVASNTMALNGRMPVQLRIPVPATVPCMRTQATYFGNPLEDVSVFVRTYRGKQAGVVTRADGQAALCMAAASRKKPFLVWGRSGGLAATQVVSCRNSRCYPVSCKRATLSVKKTRLSAYKMRFKLAVKCGRRLMFGEPVKINGINALGRPRKLKAYFTGTKTQTFDVTWQAKYKLRALKVRFGGDKTFKLTARVRGIPLVKRATPAR